MKRFLYNIVIFLIVYALVHVFVASLFSRNWNYYRIGSSRHMYSRIKEIPLHHNPDILFLGSSHTYRGFDSRIFAEHGITTFNLGSSAQTPKQTEVLLTKYLSEINPKMIVFEVNPWVFQSEGIESTTDLISNDQIDCNMCKLAILSGNVKVINTLIYGLYQEQVCNIRESFIEDRNKDGDLYVSGGFVEKLEYSPFRSDSVLPCSSKFIIRSDQLHAFKRCINIIKSYEIPYLLVMAPLPQSTYQSIGNVEEFGCIVSSYGKYVDFNSIVQLEDSCFYDSDHLAQNGVRLFNESLMQVMDSIDLH